MPTYIKIKVRRDTTANWNAANPVLELGEIGADMTQHRLKVGDSTTPWKNLPYCDPELVNDLISGGTDKALTAEQGRVLKGLADTNNSNISTLQSTLSTLQTIVNSKVDNTTFNNEINNLRNEIQQVSISSGGGPAVLDQAWSSTSKTDALSANSGRVLKGWIDQKADQEDVDELNEHMSDIEGQLSDINDKVEGLGIFGMGYTIDEFNQYSKPTKITFEDGVTATLSWTGGTQLKKITASTGEIMTMNYDENGRIIGRTITR